jgi:hypothetical protein
MFYIAEAFLEGKGLSFSKHSIAQRIYGLIMGYEDLNDHESAFLTNVANH